MRHLRRIGPVLAVIVAAATLAHAADIKNAVAEAEGRKRAAENGAREIRAKSIPDAEQVKALYTAAASANNAWVEALSGGNVAAAEAAASPAASALVKWVAARNRVLGVAALTDTVAASAETRTRQNLLDIAKGTAASKKRSEAQDIAVLLRWKTWDELQ